MRSHVILTREPIEAALAALGSSWAAGPEVLGGAAGARLDFHGIVRRFEDGEDHCGHPEHSDTPPAVEPPAPFAISAIDYEAHEEMARHQIRRILAELDGKYPLEAMLVIHRIGLVPVGEASLLVRIFSGHREEALRACAEFIDQLKRWVPIWKHPVAR